MITRKPKSFSLVYSSGVRPALGTQIYRQTWRSIRSTMARLAADTGEPLTLVSHDNGDSITVSPEGRWS